MVLNSDITQVGLQAGNVGTIVHTYPNAAAFEVEFVALDGSTALEGRGREKKHTLERRTSCSLSSM